MVGPFAGSGEDAIDDDVEHFGDTVATHGAGSDARAEALTGDAVVTGDPCPRVDALHAVEEDHGLPRRDIGMLRLPLA